MYYQFTVHKVLCYDLVNKKKKKMGSWPLNPDICNLKFTLNRAGEREIIEAIFGGRMEVGADMK